MKSCVLFVLLFGITVSLFAQAAVNIPLYVPPVAEVDDETLTEDTAFDLIEDAAIFTDLLTRELEAWNFELTPTREEADYALVSTVAFVGSELGPDGEPLEDEQYELTLAFQDKEGITLYEQSLRYNTIEDVHAYIQPMLLNMFANVFVMYVAEVPLEEEEEPEIDPDLWRKRFSYMGASFFWSPRIYRGDLVSSNLANFGFGISAEFQFIRFAAEKRQFFKYLSMGTGFEFVPDWVVATDRANDEWRNTILQIPLRLQFVVRPGKLFMHQPWLGVHFNIPFYKDTTPALISWDVGFQFGIKAGPGIAFAELRYSMDIGKSGLNVTLGDKRTYDRFVIHLGLGYKYDLVGMIQEIVRNRPPREKIAKISPEEPPPEEEPLEEEPELPPDEEPLEEEPLETEPLEELPPETEEPLAAEPPPEELLNR